MTLILRNVEVEGRRGLDVRLAGGRISEVGPRLARPTGAEEIDGQGGALIPGLWDHHIHILGLAARTASVDLSQVRGAAALLRAFEHAINGRPAGAWIRAIGYHEAHVGELSRDDLDRLCPVNPVRIQHQTGSLWILNSAALAILGEGDDPPELDRPLGRLWRGDAWLRSRLGEDPPPLAPVGARLAAYGVTGLTDASVTTDPSAAELLAAAHRTGALPQRLTLMSGGPLQPPPDEAFAVGPVKVLLDDHSPLDFDTFVGRIEGAREEDRAVAVHCVTAGELALTLAAFGAAGARPGDRIEHGSVIPAEALPVIRDLGLTVVSQPAFIMERGDRYQAHTAEADRGDLYRLASLRRAGIPLAASSDAPYASADPWTGIAAAVSRRTAGGATVGPEDALTPRAALDLYLGDPADPGGPPRRVTVGAPADVVLLRQPLDAALEQPSAEQVRATLIAGRPVKFA